jgi:hypothetical protein
MKMFGFFKKKKEKKEPETMEKHEIPEEYREELYKLSDAYLNKKGNNQLERYALWSRIQEIFPDLDIKDTGWMLNSSSILTPVLLRKKQ